jgi:antitoxin component of MazEF toxin-antitoxin module
MKRKVVRVGNALAVTLPKEFVRGCNLKLGETVDVTSSAGRIEITPRREWADIAADWYPIESGVSLEDLAGAVREERDAR